MNITRRFNHPPHNHGILSGNGELINSVSNALNTHDADVHRNPINHFLYQNLLPYTLASDVSSQDSTITLTSVVGLAAGTSYLHITDIANDTHDHDILRVISIAGNVVTLNRPIDKDYLAVSTSITSLNREMNVTGTLASPISFVVLPSPGEAWHLTSMDFSIIDSTDMDDSKFGGIASLTNGIVIRNIDSINGVYETFSTWRKNSDFVSDGFVTKYSTKAPAGSFGYSGSMGLHSGYGSVVRLANTPTETIYLEVLIQDDLINLDSFTLKVHGHIEGS